MYLYLVQISICIKQSIWVLPIKNDSSFMWKTQYIVKHISYNSIWRTSFKLLLVSASKCSRIFEHIQNPQEHQELNLVLCAGYFLPLDTLHDNLYRNPTFDLQECLSWGLLGLFALSYAIWKCIKSSCCGKNGVKHQN